MDKKPIKDFYNRIIGYIETDNKGNKIGRDFYNRIVGYYRKDQDVTKDFYYRDLNKGDTLAALIVQEEAKRGKR